MAGELIDDLEERALERLPVQHRGKTNITLMIETHTGPIQDLENVMQDMLTQRSVDTAVGTQLDIIGKIVGQPRDGFDDDDYRRLVRARIAANRSQGTTHDILTVQRGVFPEPEASLIITMQFPAAFALRVAHLAITDTIASIAAGFLVDTVSAGVRALLEYQYRPDAEMFCFVDGPGLGFNQGRFAGVREFRFPTAQLDQFRFVGSSPGRGFGDTGDPDVGGRFFTTT